MNNRANRIIVMVLGAMLLAFPALASAQEIPAGFDRPTVPADASGWAGAMVIVILAMFLMAMVIGPSVRAEIVEQPHAAHDDHSHDAGDAHGHH